jgi:hypothetical protein
MMQLAKAFTRTEGARNLRARKEFFERQYQLDRALRRALDAGREGASGSTLADVFALWGDPLEQGGEHYLRSALQAARTVPGDVLQCGASLSTLLVGAACAGAPESPRRVWCLEHDAHQANVIRSWVTLYGVANVHIVVARPRMFDGYCWYALDPGLLPGRFALILCEGGRATPRGAVGLVRRAEQKIADDGVLLVRQLHRGEDHRWLSAWASSRGQSCVLVDRKEGFVKIGRGAAGA